MLRREGVQALQTLSVVGCLQPCVEIGAVGLIQHRLHVGALVGLGRSLTASCLKSLFVVELITDVFGDHELSCKAMRAALLKDIKGELLLIQGLVRGPWLTVKIRLQLWRRFDWSLLLNRTQLICRRLLV